MVYVRPKDGRGYQGAREESDWWAGGGGVVLEWPTGGRVFRRGCVADCYTVLML